MTIVAGIEIPSANPVFLAVVAVHVLLGLACTVTGAIAMLSQKRAGRHPRYGTIYFWCLPATPNAWPPRAVLSPIAGSIPSTPSRASSAAPIGTDTEAAARSYLVDARMPPIMSVPGLFRAREIWIDDALCRAARCRRIALRQRRVAALVIVEPPSPYLCRQTG